MTAKIIQLSRPPKWMTKAMELLQGMPVEDVEKILGLVINELLQEVKKGLEHDDEEESEFFEVVNQLFIESRRTGCFLCDPFIDVNDEAVTFMKTGMCIPCSHRMSKIFDELGIDQGD